MKYTTTTHFGLTKMKSEEDKEEKKRKCRIEIRRKRHVPVLLADGVEVTRDLRAAQHQLLHSALALHECLGEYDEALLLAPVALLQREQFRLGLHQSLRRHVVLPEMRVQELVRLKQWHATGPLVVT